MNEKSVHERRWWILGVLCLSLLVIAIDNTILNVALPSIGRELHASESELQWIVDSYMLVFAGLLLAAGALGDRFGRKRSLLAGLTVFGASSVAAALSTSSGMLIGSRAAMGLGAALIMPSTLSILTNAFPVSERAKAIGIWSSVWGIGIVAGPVGGGALLKGFSWGSVFLVNVPIAILALVAAHKLVPESSDPETPPLDTRGALLSIGSLTALVWAIIEAPSRGWSSPTILAGFGVAAVLALAFCIVELRSRYPMFDIRLFREMTFSAATGSIAFTMFALMGMIFFLTQYLQSVMGYSALEAGVRVIPVAVGTMPASALSAKLTDRYGVRLTVTAGLLITAVSLGLLALVSVGSGYALIGVSFLLLGVGMGISMPPATDAVMGSLPASKAGVGSGMNDMTRQVGGALGVAVLGSIASSVYRGKLPVGVPDAAKDSLVGALAAAGSRNPELVHSAQSAFTSGMHVAVLFGTGFTLVGALLAFAFLPGRAATRPEGARLEPVAA
jgi:EmrB/QacA subfamily drug resistance transporter